MIYDKSNIFAQMLRGEVSVKPVYEDDDVLAFNDISPAAPIHVLIIPKGAYVSFDDFVLKAGFGAVGRFFAAVQKVAQQAGVCESGYRLITNHGRHASQTVEHFHVHLVAGRHLGGLLPGDAEVR